MNMLKALAVGIVAYLGMVLAVLFVPVIAILGLWIGLCVLASIFLFVLWLVTHDAHTLAMAGAMLAWGAPPFVAATVLGYFGGQLRARRSAPMVTLNKDASFR
jgi:hypothetical protein